MKQIPLTKGKFAIVDDEDYPYLSRFKWYVHVTKIPSGRIYERAVRSIGDNLFFMDSFLITSNNGVIRHKNYNGLDNRKDNLIELSKSICSHNSKKCEKIKGKKTSSKYRGVVLRKDWKNKWEARISFNKKRISLGFFDTEEEAGLAYNKKAKELYGKFAYQNNIK